ncbi:AAA family ATPase [Flavobacterium sp.]|uniref:AAA family ATPase n=1 Tax=Flavobacterium sp. TaxID=239 RepID=UPI003750BACF
MKINSIQIQNFRLLRNFQLDLEEELSLVIGKNNSGKTSILAILDKFINSEKSKFTSEDFNLKFKSELKKLIENDFEENEDEFDLLGKNLGIKLRLVIQYDENDDLSNVSNVMMNLEPENNIVVLGFDFVINYERYKNFRKDFIAFRIKEQSKVQIKQISLEESKPKEKKDNENEDEKKYIPYGFNEFLKKYFLDYFKIYKGPLDWDNDNNCIIEKTIVGKENFSEIINFKFIKAKRDVNNNEKDKTLSKQTSEIYKKEETNELQDEKIEKFKDELSNTDRVLTKIYDDIFESVINDIREFGGLKKEETNIQIFSTLQDRELLEGNTTVMYIHGSDNDKLPEHYNGLGYMNLISLIFDIKIQVEDFKKSREEKPSNINLLFIEEPEAHTHPQMQYVFIKNIKKLLKAGIEKKIKNDEKKDIIIKRELQYIISTHSSHIVAESKFEDIKYLKKQNEYSVISMNLKDLEKEYNENGEEQNYRFLKQYLTLNRAELFFTDKTIFIEGDTERILLPAMMKKIDNEFQENKLLSQNISIVEVGNYVNIFERFINFIGMKSLVITDLDSVKYDFVKNKDGSNKVSSNGKIRKAFLSCRVNDGEKSSSPTLNYFFKDTDFETKKITEFNKKRFLKEDKQWKVSEIGYLQIVYQTSLNHYHARSFEDAFFNIQENIDFIKSNRSKFRGLKNVKFFYDDSFDAYDLALNCIESKGTFAVDILFLSSYNDYNDWQIPAYIKEGLLWLKEN